MMQPKCPCSFPFVAENPAFLFVLFVATGFFRNNKTDQDHHHVKENAQDLLPGISGFPPFILIFTVYGIIHVRIIRILSGNG